MAAIVCGFAVLPLVFWLSKQVSAACQIRDACDDLEADTQFRRAVLQCVDEALPSTDGSAIKAVVRDIACTDGYDICGTLSDLARYDLDAVDKVFWEDRNISIQDTAAYLNADVLPNRTRTVPKFAAACVVTLKAKFGALERSNANFMVVQHAYLKLCKEHRVRQCDIVRHRQVVLNCFFGSNYDAQFAYARYNAPRWVKWLHGISTQEAAPLMAC